MSKGIEKIILAMTCLLTCGCTKASAHSGEATLAVKVVNTTADGKQATEKQTVAKTEKKKDTDQKEEDENEKVTDNETLSTNGKKTETGTKTGSSSNSTSSSNTTPGKAESSSGTQKTENSTKTNTETQKPAVTLPTTPAPESTPTPAPEPAPAPEPEPVTEDPYVVTSWYGDPSVADIEAYLVANGFDKWMTNHKTFAVSEYGSFDSVMSAKKSFYGSLNEYSQADSSEIYLYFDHEKGVILSSCPMDNRIYRDGIGYVDFLNTGVITCTANVFMYN